MIRMLGSTKVQIMPRISLHVKTKTGPLLLLTIISIWKMMI